MKVMLLLLLLAAASSKAQLVTYLFPENKDITICPPITSSTTLPSFKLEPVSATGHDQFLIGSYEVSDTGIPGVDIARENVSCTNDSARTCTQLTVRYGGDRRRLGRDSFIVTYTAANGVTREIRVNFGYVGVYLLKETPGLVVGRQPNLTIAANNSLVIFGTINRRVTCLENGTEAPGNLLIFAPESFSNDVCFGNNQQQTNSQPGLLTVFLANRTGQERIYFVDSTSSDCSSDKISDTFLFIFDPPSIDRPGPTTTQPPGSTTTQPINPGLPLGAVIGLAAVVASLLVVGVILSVILIVWWRRRHREATFHNGMTKQGLPPGVDGHDRAPSPDIPGNRNERAPLVDDVPPPPPPPPPPMLNKKMYILLSIDNEKVKQLKQKLCEKFSHLKLAILPSGENGSFQRYLTKIRDEQDLVIILGDTGEITYDNMSQSNKISLGRKCLTAFASLPVFSEMLQYVFLVRFGTNETLSIYEAKFHQVPVEEHPDNDNFDPPAVAKFIHEQIEDKLASISSYQHQTPNHLRPNGNSSQSASHSPLQNRSSTSDLGSSDVSESSLIVPTNENETGAGGISDTSTNVDEIDASRNLLDRDQGSPRPLADPRLTKIKNQSHELPVPQPGGLNSDSAASIKDYMDEKIDELKKVVIKQGELGRVETKEQGELNRAETKEQGELGRAEMKEQGELNRAETKEQGELNRAETKEQGELNRAETKEQGELGRAETKEQGELGRAEMRAVQEDVQYLGDIVEESRKEKQDGQDQVIKPGDNTT